MLQLNMTFHNHHLLPNNFYTWKQHVTNTTVGPGGSPYSLPLLEQLLPTLQDPGPKFGRIQIQIIWRGIIKNSSWHTVVDLGILRVCIIKNSSWHS